jgi:hypothetical protein
MQRAGDILQYHAEVHKGSVNMRVLTSRLNETSQQGWRLQAREGFDKPVPPA